MRLEISSARALAPQTPERQNELKYFLNSRQDFDEVKALLLNKFDFHLLAIEKWFNVDHDLSNFKFGV